MGERPDPDALLARVDEEEKRAKRGKLTIFFGAAPGVGKTYAMLEAARFEREDGRDVVVGLVETHGRYDTAALLLGLEILPRRKSEHRGVTLEELDVDACLARRPGVILVDELAHTNAPGSRHVKRWQDVDELLDAGLDVYSTLNVQHLESLNDVVAQITHVVVRETVPDSVLEKADDIRLIDLPIDELLARLKEGKVYLGEQAQRAGKSFFRPGNLIALRELALRVTAQSVDQQMRRYRTEHGIDRTWAATERILVSVSPSPASERLVRGARRLAGSLHADWIAAYVETPASLRLSARDRAQIADNLQLARTLGAETVTLAGERGAEEVVRFARQRNVTRIVVGKPTHSTWRDRIREPFVESLVRLSGDIDVHVMTGEVERPEVSRAPEGPALAPRRRSLAGFVAGPVVVTIASLAGHALFGRSPLADVVMVYLFGIVLVSLRWGLGPSLCASVLSVLALDFFFVPPFHTFAVGDLRHVVTFAVMFMVATIISGLTKRVRDQAEAARSREVRTASLYALSRALAAAKTRREVLSAGTKQTQEVFGGRAVALVPSPSGGLVSNVNESWTYVLDEKERGVAEWVWHHGRPAGSGTDTLPSATAMYLPIEGSEARHGVLGVMPGPGGITGELERPHLEAFLAQMGSALDRIRLAKQAHDAQLRVEAEQLRNSLLSSVSHDLRTPLAVITGTASSLANDKLDADQRRDLADTIVQEAERLSRLVRDLLDMTRVEAGALSVHKEWQPVEEVVGSALASVERLLGSRPVATDLSGGLLAPFDAVLIQQVLVNLLENAAKYAGPEAPITISARGRKREVEIVVSDRGVGLPPGDETRIFEKFYRAEKGKGGGVGLGLTICRGIVTAHGGRIWAKNRDDGGASFHFTLPVEGEPPVLDLPESQRIAEEHAHP
jgi:two-component system sensor histidine kinase KdpD